MTRDEVIAGAREAIHRGSKSFRAASQLFDSTTRERAWLLYCWCRHCDDVADGQVYGFGKGESGSVPELRAKTMRAAAGKDVQELAFQALRQLQTECPLPVTLLDDHLQGFELDEAGWRPRSSDDLVRYCYHVAGSVGCMMAVVMGVSPEDEETLSYAADLGIAFQLSNIARDLREDLEAGRCYLPRQWLAEFAIDPDQLFEPANRAALLQMARRLVDLAAVHETRARRGVRRLPFRSRLAVLAALRIYGAIGRRVAALGDSAWDQRVKVGRLRKLGFVLPSFAEALIVGRR